MRTNKGNYRVFMKWYDEWQRAMINQGMPHTPNQPGMVADTMKAMGAFARLELGENAENVPPSDHFQVNEQWIDAGLKQLFEFNAMGDEYICSIAEAVIKCNGLKALLDQFTQPYYFRGERNFGWELVSKLGRHHDIDWDNVDAGRVTPLELELLAEFQRKHVADTGCDVPLHNAGWWSLMQHYDNEAGTRMIDLTSSVYCALYFACAHLNGEIDDSVDGKLWAFPYSPGRGEADDAKGDANDIEDKRESSVEDYFSLASNVDVPRFRQSAARNDRAIAQDGYFVWQARFNEPLVTYQYFAFRVHRDFKQSIVQELSAMGYTRERLLATHML